MARTAKQQRTMTSTVSVKGPAIVDAKPKFTSIPREKVKSSNIKTMGYSEREQAVEIEFHNPKNPKWDGAVWRYYPISPKAFDQLKKAKSIGSHFHQYIKSNNAITQTKMSDARK